MLTRWIEKRRLRAELATLLRAVDSGSADPAAGGRLERVAARLAEIDPPSDYYNPFGL